MNFSNNIKIWRNIIIDESTQDGTLYENDMWEEAQDDNNEDGFVGEEMLDEGIFFRSSANEKAFKQLCEMVSKLKESGKFNDCIIKVKTQDKEGKHGAEKHIKGMKAAKNAGFIQGGTIAFVVDEKMDDDLRAKVLASALTDSRSKGSTGSFDTRSDDDIKNTEEYKKSLNKYKIDISDMSTKLTLQELERIMIKDAEINNVRQNLKNIILVDNEGFIMSKDILGVAEQSSSLWFGFALTQSEQASKNVWKW